MVSVVFHCSRNFVYQEALTRTPANGIDAEIMAAIICREAECGSEDWAAAGRAVAAVESFRHVAA